MSEYRALIRKYGDLKPQYKIYQITMMRGDRFEITEDLITPLLEAKSNLIRLPDGSVINTSSIEHIVLDQDLTCSRLRRLDYDDQRKSFILEVPPQLSTHLST